MLVDFETFYISLFKSKFLYNFKWIAVSMLGYKHTVKVKQKMINPFKISTHPLLGKNHTLETKEEIKLATSGIKNPMFGKTHSDNIKNLISSALGKPVYFYKLIDNNLELFNIFPSSVKVGEFLNLHKSTIGKYIKKRYSNYTQIK